MSRVSVLSARGRLSVIRPSLPRRSKMMSDVPVTRPTRSRRGARPGPSLAIAAQRSPLGPQQLAGNDHPHDLIGALQDAVHPEVAQHALDRMVLEVAVAAVELQGLVGDLKTGVGGEALGHGGGD